ncbi:MAG: DNA gyrase inhibitor YacG, partial [Pseudomonadales bacterium]
MTDAIVQCPTCRKAVAWIATNRYKPFCSERCQLIDLGESIKQFLRRLLY